ncbi:SAM-dependent methyltransferase [Halomicronema hongdechloris C2206]|uniref:SAM-dependent methyltransferase n=1 Tax=Halomicronema hongdechloris C2206 TaxID=1641165 RepID=A0A1Z3HIE9_9CYAN|nr:class I SAM-dependent methyltransferase [Halomicronema hongdechloris]ASC70036.1 SAM-dependent methyltransferase [Halomicronema hongdechloris C2206]
MKLSEIHRRTIEVYETQAGSWDRHRPRTLNERVWLDKFTAAIPPYGTVLDVGCGGGDPIARYFIERNFALTGVDAAKAMIEIARTRFPAMTWIQMDMRELSLNQTFDGIIGWDSFFHLNPAEQRLTLMRFVTHLKSGGALLLTVGHTAGEVLGQVEGQRVYHSSLDPTEYKSILIEAGFCQVEYVAQDQRCGMRSLVLASCLHPRGE